MSATNRGAVRRENDYYSTPLESFTPLIPYIKQLGVSCFEPACGDGRLVTALRENGITAWGRDIAIDGYDFLQDANCNMGIHCIVTNPPFSLAQEFVTHAVANSENVFMLLPLNFLGAQKRKEWWKLHEPGAIFVLSERPSFVISCRCLGRGEKDGCCHRFSMPPESPRPIHCPNCAGPVKTTSSDACEYGWYFFGSAFSGIIHL